MSALELDSTTDACVQQTCDIIVRENFGCNGVMEFRGRSSTAARSKKSQTTICLLRLQQRCTNWLGMPSACTFARKYIFRERGRNHKKFSETPEIQFWRYEHYFFYSSARKLNRQTAKGGIVILRPCAHRGFSRLFNSAPMQFNFKKFAPG